ncbi:MAG: hypothetical protein Q4Q07_08175 [Tissierellia bacterium]|nr:hypothetical protein [Tissierellia bacterium]
MNRERFIHQEILFPIFLHFIGILYFIFFKNIEVRAAFERSAEITLLLLLTINIGTVINDKKIFK